PGSGGPRRPSLARMRFLMGVERADVTAGWALLSLVGPNTDEALTALGGGPLLEPDEVAVPGPKFATGSVPPRPTTVYDGAALATFGGWVRRVRGGADLLVPRAAMADVVEA